VLVNVSTIPGVIQLSKIAAAPPGQLD